MRRCGREAARWCRAASGWSGVAVMAILQLRDSLWRWLMNVCIHLYRFYIPPYMYRTALYSYMNLVHLPTPELASENHSLPSPSTWHPPPGTLHLAQPSSIHCSWCRRGVAWCQAPPSSGWIGPSPIVYMKVGLGARLDSTEGIVSYKPSAYALHIASSSRI